MPGEKEEKADKAVKSAYELAMERLRKKDQEEGVAEPAPLTDKQKAAIAEIRNFYEAKLAEAELLHQDRMLKTFDPVERAKNDEEYRRDRERLAGDRDAKIEKIRKS